MNKTYTQHICWLVLLTFSISKGIAQTSPKMIDFEEGLSTKITDFTNPMNAVREDPYVIDNQYFKLNYGVRFLVSDGATTQSARVAKVGDQGTFAGFGGPSVSNAGCGIFSPISVDMPAESAQASVGCHFLAVRLSDRDFPGPDAKIIIDYEDRLTCSQASGDIIDLDGEEGWEINVFAVGNDSDVPDQTTTLCSPYYKDCSSSMNGSTVQSIGGDGELTHWTVGLEGQSIDRIEFKYVGNNVPTSLALDNLAFCSSKAGASDVVCCDENNLALDGDFNDRVPMFDFRSFFKHEPATDPSAVIPGEFVIVNQEEAKTISKLWDAQDCNNDNGTFMVVNGKTGQESGTPAANAVVWEQTISSVEPLRDYVFCASFRNLDQLAFNVAPKVTINFVPVGTQSVPFHTIPAAVISTDPTDPCDWQAISAEFTSPKNLTQFRIQILLDQTTPGDGNDLALDNISIGKVEDAPKISVELSSHHLDENHFELVGGLSDNTPMPDASCEAHYAWEVAELNDPTDITLKSNARLGGSDTVADWPLTGNKFPGYTFEYRKWYIVSLTVDCDCRDASTTYQLVYNHGTGDAMLNR